jgi:quercetin dioxygenase-like cupin family protein
VVRHGVEQGLALSAAGYRIFRREELEFARPSGGDQERGIVRLSEALEAMRANIWRMPPGARGRRHRELVQEELFVVLEGTATLLLGEPPEPVELPSGSLAVVEPETALQLANEGDEEAVVLIVGAPPVEGQAEYLPD